MLQHIQKTEYTSYSQSERVCRSLFKQRKQGIYLALEGEVKLLR